MAMIEMRWKMNQIIQIRIRSLVRKVAAKSLVKWDVLSATTVVKPSRIEFISRSMFHQKQNSLPKQKILL